MKKSDIIDIIYVSSYQVHVVLENKVVLLDTTCEIDGIYFNSSQEMIDYFNQV